MIGTWDKSLETGNKMIDRQHRELIHLIDELSEDELKSDEDVLSLLDRMMEFALLHFLSEEELMRHVGYPSDDRKAMIEQHQAFKSYVRTRVLDFRQGEGLSAPELKESLRNFLIEHEFGLDRLLADWIRRRNEIS